MALRLVYLISTDSFFLSHFVTRAEEALRQGYEVTVLAKKTTSQSVEKIEKLGIKFIDTGIERASIGLFTEFKSLIRLVKTYRKLRPNIAHHYGTKSIFYGTISSLLLKTKPKIVNNLIGLGVVFASENLKAKLLKKIILLGYRYLLNPKGSVVVCENRDDLKFFIDNGSLKKDRAYFIPGAGVNTELFRPGTAEDKKDKITVAMCSRLLKSKGVYTFVEAAKIIKKDGYDVNVWLVGKPDMSNPDSITDKEIENWSTRGVISYLGYSENVELILRKADICCLPSYYREGLPRSLIEGASCGLPIVTTDVIGCREAVVMQNGILIKPKDPLSLAQALEKIIKDQNLRLEMGKRSRLLALRDFDEKIINKKIMNLYSCLV